MKKLLFVLMIIGLFMCAGIASASISVCVNSLGTIKYLSPGKSCPKNQTMLTWNEKGLQGDPGVAGPAGPAGQQGPAGKDGAAGAGQLVLVDKNGLELGILISASELAVYNEALDTVLVLSGVTQQSDLERFAYSPHMVLGGVGEIVISG